jgi:hypothetical protein
MKRMEPPMHADEKKAIYLRVSVFICGFKGKS